MSVNDKNIIITPNKGSSSEDPTIVFAGANASVGAQTITLKVYPDSNGTIALEGSAGQLFSVTNSLDGSIFSVNDVSGLPSIEVFDTGDILLAEFGGRVGIGTDSPATLCHINGTIRYTNRPAAGTITAIGYDENGDLKNSSSSLRYKHDVVDYDKGLEEVLHIFKFNGEERTNSGFIAEDVDAIGLSEVMLYDEEGRPDGVLYANMVALLTKALQEQQQQIQELQLALANLNNQ